MRTDRGFYIRQHAVTRRRYGSASGYPCVTCPDGGMAKDWATIHGHEGVYDRQIFVDCVPMCRSCNLRYDYTDDWWDKRSLTPAVRGEVLRKRYEDPEARRRQSDAVKRSIVPGQRRAAALKISPEERSERTRKGWATRRARAGA